jgi:hypothetical protein
MPALMASATLLRREDPLPATAALSCACALGTCEISYTAGPAMPFFIPEACGPKRTTGHMAAPEPLRNMEKGSEAA